MVPTLDKNAIQDRMSEAAKLGTGGAEKYFRKRKSSGVSSLELRLKHRIGKNMNSRIQPKTGLENKEC